MAGRRRAEVNADYGKQLIENGLADEVGDKPAAKAKRNRCSRLGLGCLERSQDLNLVIHAGGNAPPGEATGFVVIAPWSILA